jgi:6-pyruvoyltetrahydropterin/6-carboxytetrahydropterin synthase
MKLATRRLTFEAGHRIVGHEGKCRHVHGHSYKVFISAHSEVLDSLGRVIDFSVLKHKVGNWIEQNLDHGMIIFSEDGDMIKLMAALPEQKFFLLPYNTTAENIAKYILEDICPSLLKDSGVTITKIVVQETENCIAEISL